MKISKLILTIILISAFLAESSGVGYALRPMAYKTLDKQHKKIKRIKSILGSLRPDFNKKKELSVEEFEKHIQLMAKEQNINYIKTDKQAISFLYSLLKDSVTHLYNGNFFSYLGTFHGLISLMFVPSFLRRYDENGNMYEIEIKLTGHTVFLMSLVAAIIASIFLPFLIWFYYWAMTLANIAVAFFIKDWALGHELRHAYIGLLLNRLEKEGLINSNLEWDTIIRACDESIESLHSCGIITFEEFEEIEEVIIDNYIALHKEDLDKEKSHLKVKTKVDPNLAPLTVRFKSFVKTIEDEPVDADNEPLVIDVKELKVIQAIASAA